VLATFALEAATSYFAPAYGALLPALVDRRNVQAANGLVRATPNALSIGGWAIAAGLVAVLPISAFFALNAASFAISAALIARIRRSTSASTEEPPRIRESFAALRPLPVLATAVVVLGVAETISSGTWIGGMPELVRTTLHHGAGGFSIVILGYAVGALASGATLARWHVRRKARASMLAWTMYLVGYGSMAFAPSLLVATLGGAACGLGQGSSVVLINSAAQEEVRAGSRFRFDLARAPRRARHRTRLRGPAVRGRCTADRLRGGRARPAARRARRRRRRGAPS
jgi:hypothetical protein